MNVMDDDGLTPAPIEARYCDTCNAHALVYADINGTELAYCGHHGNEYLPKLMQLGIVIIDLRHTLEATP